MKVFLCWCCNATLSNFLNFVFAGNFHRHNSIIQLKLVNFDDTEPRLDNILDSTNTRRQSREREMKGEGRRTYSSSFLQGF